MTDKEFAQMNSQRLANLFKSGLRAGPQYGEGESAPVVWHDQVFERGFLPSGAVECETALRVGSTQNGLDVILVASHENEDALAIAAGATITLTTLQGDSQDGEFTEIGPAICVTAPAEGISAEPDMLCARFAIGNFQKPWLKVKLEFSGSISGGNMDCALSYVPR